MTGAAGGPPPEVLGLSEHQLRLKSDQLDEEIRELRARMSLLLAGAVQYELDQERLGGDDGIEIIASVASMPSARLWELLSGHYRPTAETWIRIERILALCDAKRGVERATAAQKVFERIAELSSKKERVINQRIELQRRRRVMGAGPAAALRPSNEPTGIHLLLSGMFGPGDEPEDAPAENVPDVDEPFIPPAIPDLKGHDYRPNPLRAATQAEFVAIMREYHAWAGKPSYREMERRCRKQVSYSTFRNMLNRGTFPGKLSSIETFVRVLGGTPEDHQRWATAWRRLAMGKINKRSRREREPVDEENLRLLPRTRSR